MAPHLSYTAVGTRWLSSSHFPRQTLWDMGQPLPFVTADIGNTGQRRVSWYMGSCLLYEGVTRTISTQSTSTNAPNVKLSKYTWPAVIYYIYLLSLHSYPEWFGCGLLTTFTYYAPLWVWKWQAFWNGKPF